ncbi:unnamed protein product, partial [Schistosoma curassoni]|uniref:Histidine kinase n=1 Tax=Schistosoma curassoni TaxID=6186 RepID=A0A183JSF9_9TREM
MKDPGTGGLVDIQDMKENVVINGAIKLTDELAILPNGDIVATKPLIENQRFIIAENISQISDRNVYGTHSGEMIVGAEVDDNGIIHLPDSTLAITVSLDKDRYVILKNNKTQRESIFDRRLGTELVNATLHHNGMIKLATG